MTKRFCDKCGRELDSRGGFDVTVAPDSSYKNYYYDSKNWVKSSFELCPLCKCVVLDLIKGKK